MSNENIGRVHNDLEGSNKKEVRKLVGRIFNQPGAAFDSAKLSTRKEIGLVNNEIRLHLDNLKKTDSSALPIGRVYNQK